MAGIRAKLITADGCTQTMVVRDDNGREPRVLRTAIMPPLGRLSLDPSPVVPRSIERVYELYGCENTEREGFLFIYREKVTDSSIAEQESGKISAADLARAMFDEAMLFDARIIAERPERVRAVLDVMWEKTRPEARLLYAEKAAAILGAAKIR